MAATTKTVISKRQLDFTDIQGTEMLKFAVQRAVDVSAGTSVEVLLRVHDREISGSASVNVLVCPVSLTPEEPQTDFMERTVITSVAVTASTPASVPGLIVASMNGPYGSQLQVLVAGTGDSGAANRATISVDLVVRD